MTKKTEGWFDCLNAVAIETECDKDESSYDTLLNVMAGAGITLDEVCWAQRMGYTTLNECGILKDYEHKIQKS